MKISRNPKTIPIVHDIGSTHPAHDGISRTTLVFPGDCIETAFEAVCNVVGVPQ
jgi:hypothetical protein